MNAQDDALIRSIVRDEIRQLFQSYNGGGGVGNAGGTSHIDIRSIIREEIRSALDSARIVNRSIVQTGGGSGGGVPEYLPGHTYLDSDGRVFTVGSGGRGGDAKFGEGVTGNASVGCSAGSAGRPLSPEEVFLPDPIGGP